ncbi:hypothetical protein WH47_00279 [Habropoda laboriosa]|uniref:Uncharacterized protein n=1 Tax=Habropoda laboriosa TaxID=597456 RepID=A0A0L7R1V5_9HYME|nr:hypothetical protein WH47_00279 [Habropoda laboriosa]
MQGCIEHETKTVNNNVGKQKKNNCCVYFFLLRAESLGRLTVDRMILFKNVPLNTGCSRLKCVMKNKVALKLNPIKRIPNYLC